MSHDGKIALQGQIFILAGYKVNCSGTVVAWEFCYRLVMDGVLVTFYPGIWRITGTSGGSSTDYELIQSNSITYNRSIQTNGVDSCQRVNLSTTDQFTAPAGSVVGLYSNNGTTLLHTNTNSLIANYRFVGNQSSISTSGGSINADYNIAIRVHLGKPITDEN